VVSFVGEQRSLENKGINSYKAVIDSKRVGKGTEFFRLMNLHTCQMRLK